MKYIQKQAMIKLAQVRLAINHVLRQRTIKKATLERSEPRIPIWHSNPYDDGREYSYKEQQPGPFQNSTLYFRSQEDLDNYSQGKTAPEDYRPQTRFGNISDTINPTPRMIIGPWYNRGIQMLKDMAYKKRNDWTRQKIGIEDDITAAEEAKGNKQPWRINTENHPIMKQWLKQNPEPQIPNFDQYYMKTPGGYRY